MMNRILVFLILLMPLNVLAQGELQQYIIVDTLPEFRYEMKPSRIIVPAALIGVGIWGIENNWAKHQKQRLQNEIQDIADGRTTHLDDVLRFGPAVMSAALQFSGKQPTLTDKDLVLSRLNAYGIMVALTYGSKKLVNEVRPDGSDNESFPSGHCANSFMTAEMIRTEYGNLYGTAAYTMAAGVACLRLYNNKHWANDVIAGAGIGILSARMAYWLLPIEKRLLGWDNDKRTHITVVPYYSFGTNRSMGASMAVIF